MLWGPVHWLVFMDSNPLKGAKNVLMRKWRWQLSHQANPTLLCSWSLYLNLRAPSFGFICSCTGLMVCQISYSTVTILQSSPGAVTLFFTKCWKYTSHLEDKPHRGSEPIPTRLLLARILPWAGGPLGAKRTERERTSSSRRCFNSCPWHPGEP